MTENLTLEIFRNPEIAWRYSFLSTPSKKILMPKNFETVIETVCSNLKSILADFNDDPNLFSLLEKCFNIFIEHFSKSYCSSFYLSEKDFVFSFNMDEEFNEFELSFKNSESIIEISLHE